MKIALRSPYSKEYGEFFYIQKNRKTNESVRRLEKQTTDALRCNVVYSFFRGAFAAA